MSPSNPIRPFSSIFSVEENSCVAPPAEELVCRADTPAPVATSSTSLLPDFRAMAHSSYAARLLDRSRSSLASSAFGTSSSSSSPLASSSSLFSSNPLMLNGLVVFGGLPGCSHEPLDDMPPPGDPDIDDPSDDENPPVNTGGDNGGLGTINTSFANSACKHPLDLDLSSDTNSLLLTCGDRASQGDTEGVAILERINATTGHIDQLLLPNLLEDEPTKPVYLTAAASEGGSVTHVGFASDGTVAELTGGTRSLGNSGIFIVPEADENLTSHVLFNSFQRNLPGDDGRVALANLSGAAPASVIHFTPNTPVSMVRSGTHLYVLTRNHAVNPVDGSLDLAPATILRYDVNATNGSLTPVSIGAVQSNVIAGTSTPHNAYLMDGAYNPTALAVASDGRLVAVTQGIPGENASSIHVFNPDMTSGITSGAGSSEIIISDAANPDYDFVASSSSQVALYGNNAIVGSMDGSGRIAIVDVSAAGPSGGANRTRFVTVFDDGSDIANVVLNPNGQFAYVISDSGAIRAVTLTEGANFGKVGDTFSLASGVMPGTTIPAAFRSSSIIAARPLHYSRAEVH